MKIKIYSVAVKMMGVFCLLLTSEIALAERVSPESPYMEGAFVLKPGQERFIVVTCSQTLGQGSPDAVFGVLSSMDQSGGAVVTASLDGYEPVPASESWVSPICGSYMPNFIFISVYNPHKHDKDITLFGLSFGEAFDVSY